MSEGFGPLNIERVRHDLSARLEKLSGRVEKIGSNLRQPGNPDSEELATERANDEVLEALDDTERREIALIHAALQRIELGSYGICSRPLRAPRRGLS